MKPLNMGRDMTMMKNRYPEYFELLNKYKVYYYKEFRCGMSFLKLPNGSILYYTKSYQY